MGEAETVAGSFGWDRRETVWLWKGLAGGRRVQVDVDTTNGRTSVQPLDGRELDAETHARALSATLLTMVEELRSAQALAGAVEAPHAD